MIKEFGHKIKECVKAIYLFKNWLSITKSIFENTSPLLVEFTNGIIIEAPPNSLLLHLIDEIWLRKVYTPFAFEISSNDLIFDIGANIGVFSIYAALRTQNKVYAFEPFPANYNLLKQNSINNGLDNISPFSCAVSESSNTVKLYVTQSSSGNLLFDHNINGKIENYIKVESITLKKAMEINDIESIDFLKMDCEGAEFGIFQTTPQEYIRRINKIAIEFHDNVTSYNHDYIVRKLLNYNYEVDLVWDGESPFGYILAQRK